MTVVDVSAVIDLLVPRDRTQQLAIIDHLPAAGIPWLAPDVIVFEVLATVRRHWLRSLLHDASASHALDRFLRLPIETVPSRELLPAAWVLRDRCSAGDALYVALALRSSEPLLTTDVRLARAAAAAGARPITPGVDGGSGG